MPETVVVTVDEDVAARLRLDSAHVTNLNEVTYLSKNYQTFLLQVGSRMLEIARALETGRLRIVEEEE